MTEDKVALTEYRLHTAVIITIGFNSMTLLKKQSQCQTRRTAMSEEKAITKSYLEKAINARAEKRWDQDIKLVCHNLQNSPFRYSKIKTGPNMHSEINNFNLEYPENCETMLANLFEDYDEIREETIKDYVQEETDRLLESLDGISNFLNEQGGIN